MIISVWSVSERSELSPHHIRWSAMQPRSTDHRAQSKRWRSYENGLSRTLAFRAQSPSCLHTANMMRDSASGQSKCWNLTYISRHSKVVADERSCSMHIVRLVGLAGLLSVLRANDCQMDLFATPGMPMQYSEDAHWYTLIYSAASSRNQT